ncbi:Rieske (2Fe-2S) protein [Streptomyces sp. NPDC017979]|uniref:Rieske (2Fe-2S) protein n=1 Tax=Streptomyces sp. NPDC017979 TaxID=3365024 RepID=UPI0037BDC4A1
MTASPEEQRRRTVTRRTVVAAAGGAGLTAALTACGSDDGGSSGSSSTGDGGTKGSAAGGSAAGGSTGGSSGGSGQAVAKVADVPEGGGKVVGDVVITQPSAGQFKAFSSKCTHTGCAVRGVANNVITCPCHNSTFDASDGSVKGGPATAPLPAKSVRVEGDSIILA